MSERTVVAPREMSQNAPTETETQKYLSVLQSDDPQMWRVINRCGVNALYTYLSLNDLNVDYQEIMNSLPISKGGTSLRDLKHVAAHFGLESDILRVKPAALDRFIPSIVHIEEEMIVGGHYGVLVSVDPNIVTYIDGTTGALTETPRARFMELWTGYLLSEHKSVPSLWVLRVGVTFALLLFGMVVYWRIRVTK